MSIDHLPAWRQIDDVGDLVEAICRLYDERGGSNYDEAVTQTVHALQSADLAAAADAPGALVAAALLHDIGHLLLGEWEARPDFLDGDRLRIAAVGRRDDIDQGTRDVLDTCHGHLGDEDLTAA